MRARTDEAKDERRQALVLAALDEFFERGFAAARMDDIAARAGLSKGALYLYFDSKQALFEALIDAAAVPVIARVEAAAAAAPEGSEAVRAVARIAPTLLRTTPIPKLVKVIVAEGRAFPETVTRYREQVVDRALGLLESVIRRGVEIGAFEVSDPALFARLVAAPLIFATVWQVVFESADPKAALDLDALFQLHAETLLRALEPRKEAGDAA